jgi:hypothetical protein
MKIVPINLREANSFVNMFHRHSKKVQGGKFAIGLMDGLQLVGVAIAGRPISRIMDNGSTVEILRVCVKNGYKNANSMLYGRIRRICQMMGYEKVITYTLKDESQSSLLAIGAVQESTVRPEGWNRPSRKRRNQDIYSKEKIRWDLTLKVKRR